MAPASSSPLRRLSGRPLVFTPLLLLLMAACLSGTAMGQQQRHSVAEPSFGALMENATVIKGRDVSFTCVVLNIGPHRVAWIKADDKGILAMHDRVLTNNARLSVVHSDLHTWTLQIRDAHRSDRGQYMCQINSDPMRSQTAYLEVVIPPDIVSEEGGGEVLVPEGGSARLSCKARGFPQPRVTWRREDGQDIILRGGGGAAAAAAAAAGMNNAHSKTKAVQIYEGEVLTFHKITRSEMGAYLCIAANGVPPSVSRRTVVNVHFYPIIQVHNQLVGAPMGSNVTLDCVVEASPRPINYWARESGEMIISNDKYRMEEIDVNSYTTRLRLHLKLASTNDEGGYKCCSKNSIGDSEGTISVYATRKMVEEEKAKSKWTDDDELDDANSDEDNRNGGRGGQQAAPPEGLDMTGQQNSQQQHQQAATVPSSTTHQRSSNNGQSSSNSHNKKMSSPGRTSSSGTSSLSNLLHSTVTAIIIVNLAVMILVSL